MQLESVREVKQTNIVYRLPNSICIYSASLYIHTDTHTHSIYRHTFVHMEAGIIPHVPVQVQVQLKWVIKTSLWVVRLFNLSGGEHLHCWQC